MLNPGDVVDVGIYVDGVRTSTPSSLAETYEDLHRIPNSMAWIGLYRPSVEQVTSLSQEFNIHELAAEDAITAHQRPKLERYDNTLFVVVSAARYIEETEEIEFAELHIFVGPNFVLTSRHGESPDLSGVRFRLEADPALLSLGPEAVLYAILDRIVDDYDPVLLGLENDIDEIEMQVFSGMPDVSQRIYLLSREVIDFQRATHSLKVILSDLEAGFKKYGINEELQRYLRDVDDHLRHIVEKIDEFRPLLRDMLTVNATLVAQKQNDEMTALTAVSNAQNEEVKKISAWAAIIFAPSLVGTIYGMNFRYMPELDWRFGYPMALGLMLLASGTLYAIFKRRGWL